MKSFLNTIECAKVLKAMADVSRLRILNVLGDKMKSVTELMNELKLPQSNLSHHLAVLRNAGLVQTLRIGRIIKYQLHPAVCEQLPKSKQKSRIDLGCCSVDLKA